MVDSLGGHHSKNTRARLPVTDPRSEQCVSFALRCDRRPSPATPQEHCQSVRHPEIFCDSKNPSPPLTTKFGALQSLGTTRPYHSLFDLRGLGRHHRFGRRPRGTVSPFAVHGNPHDPRSHPHPPDRGRHRCDSTTVRSASSAHSSYRLFPSGIASALDHHTKSPKLAPTPPRYLQ